jgi:hypothetical protein
MYGWYVLYKEGINLKIARCEDEAEAKATSAALFREHQEIIEAGRLRGPVYKVIQGAELTKWVGCS